MKQTKSNITEYNYIARAHASALVITPVLKLGGSTGLIGTLIFLFLFSGSIVYGNPDLINQLSSSNEFDRAKAVIALGQAKDQNSVSVLANRFDTESSKKVKLYILQAFVDIGNQEAVQGLEKGLIDADSDVRVKAARSLKKFEAHRSNQALSSALNDSDSRVRAAAATSLGGDAGKQVLLELAQSEDPKICAQALLGLSSLHAKGPEVNSVIQNALSSPHKRVKNAAEWAADVLGNGGGEDEQ